MNTTSVLPTAGSTSIGQPWIGFTALNFAMKNTRHASPRSGTGIAMQETTITNMAGKTRMGVPELAYGSSKPVGMRSLITAAILASGLIWHSAAFSQSATRLTVPNSSSVISGQAKQLAALIAVSKPNTSAVSERPSFDKLINREVAAELQGIGAGVRGWNSAHPQWTRMEKRIRNDFTQLSARQSRRDDLLLGEHSRQLELGISRRMSAADIKAQVDFYKSPVGQRYLKLDKDLQSIFAECQVLYLGSIGVGAPIASRAEVAKETLSMRAKLLSMSSSWRIVESMFEEQSDKSGCAAISMMLSFCAQTSDTTIDSLQSRYESDLDQFDRMVRSDSAGHEANAQEEVQSVMQYKILKDQAAELERLRSEWRKAMQQ